MRETAPLYNINIVSFNSIITTMSKEIHILYKYTLICRVCIFFLVHGFIYFIVGQILQKNKKKCYIYTRRTNRIKVLEKNYRHVLLRENHYRRCISKSFFLNSSYNKWTITIKLLYYHRLLLCPSKSTIMNLQSCKMLRFI